MIEPRGRAGLVLPTGIATDATTAPFFSDLVRRARLVSFLDFENEAFLLSRSVDHRVRFCLLTVCGRAARVNLASFAFGTRYMHDLPDRRFTMPPEEILLVNPNTGTAPVFRSRRDAEITIGVYKRVPVLWRDDPEENPWGLSFMQGIFNMASDSGLFRTRDQLERDGWTRHGNVFARGGERMLPLYEAKMIHHFDHRLGSYEGQTEAQANVGTLPRLTPAQHDDPSRTVLPRYWVPAAEVSERLSRRGWDHGWLLGWRDICRSTDERTVIAAAIPRSAVGHTFPLILSASQHLGCLDANLASYALDYVARQKMAGTHLTYGYVTQWPVLPPRAFEECPMWDAAHSLHSWIEARVLELSYTAHDLAPFAAYLGDDGPPFRWDEQRRFAMRAELDAAFFHLYGIERDDVGYIMDSFIAFQHNDPARFERTKELIVQVYDAMAEAARTGQPYRTILDQPPGRGPRHG